MKGKVLKSEVIFQSMIEEFLSVLLVRAGGSLYRALNLQLLPALPGNFLHPQPAQKASE